MPTIDGLATGLDTTQIIESMLSIQQGQIDTFTARKERIVEDQTAFRGIEARVLTLQSRLSALSRPATNAFLRKSVTSSHEEAVTATVSNDAAVGVYSIRVTNLARNHQIASQGYVRADAAVAKGTLKLKVGDGPETSVVISNANNNLEAVANSINATSKDVTAAVVKDGVDHRLLLSSKKTGAEQTISLSFELGDPGESGMALAFDLDNPVQAAADATVQLGSGIGAITTTAATNQIDNLFNGLTLDLHQVTVDEEVTLTVSRDVEAARESVDAFVEAYNDVIDFTNELNQYDPETDRATSLFGNRTVLSIRAKLSQVISRALPVGKDTVLNRLSAIGIREEAGGKLSVRDDLLSEVLSGKKGRSDVTADDLVNLFGYAGKSTSVYVDFVTASEKTQMTQTVAEDGESYIPYTVTITRAAQQAALSATNDLASSIVIDDTNNTLDINIDNRLVNGIQLTAGTYTQQELADELETQINENEELVGRQVRVTLSGSRLQITSLSYGKSSVVKELGGSALAPLGLVGTESARGDDVAGDFSYSVDGTIIRESAKGDGRTLTGNDGNKYSAGLSVRVSLSPDQVPFGSLYTADVTVSRGIAESVDDLIESWRLNDTKNKKYGQIASAFREFDERTKSIDDSIEKLNARFEAQRTSLVAQFNALESKVSDLQNMGSLLSAQLASLPAIRT